MPRGARERPGGEGRRSGVALAPGPRPPSQASQGPFARVAPEQERGDQAEQREHRQQHLRGPERKDRRDGDGERRKRERPGSELRLHQGGI